MCLPAAELRPNLHSICLLQQTLGLLIGATVMVVKTAQTVAGAL